MNRELTRDQVLHDFFALVKRQRWVILAVVVLAVGASVALSQLRTPVYEANAELEFTDVRQDFAALGTAVLPLNPQQIAAAAEVIRSGDVVRRVQADLGGKISAAEVRGSVTSAVDPDTHLVRIRVRSDDARRAARLANSLAAATRSVVTARERRRYGQAARDLRRAIRTGRGRRNDAVATTLTFDRVLALQSLAQFAEPVTVAARATVPGSPVSPRPVRDGILALLGGLVFGLLLGIMRDSFDRRLSDPHEVQHYLHLPLAGSISSQAFGLGTAQNGKGATDWIEPFRILRSTVDFMSPETKIKTIAVTSPGAEEGKSTVSPGLAIASALADKRVLLVECDLRRPALADRFELRSSPGLSDWLTGQAAPADVMQRISIDQMLEHVLEPGGRGTSSDGSSQPVTAIVAGSFTPRPAELLGSARFSTFVDQVSRVYDLVIFDCPPLLPVGDTLEVMPLVDGVLLCIRLEHTTRDQALAAKAAIDHIPPRPVGMVITGVRPGHAGYYYGYYSSSVEPARVRG